MHFYQYYDSAETLPESPIILAAKDILTAGLKIIPLIKGAKEPANIKSVYELISHPINDKNFDYYFKGREVDLGLILEDDMEFIDIDEKNKAGITRDVLRAIESGWPELYEKLTIDFTPSGGCHLLYRSEVIGGRASLAKVPGRPNPLTIIEHCHKANKQYIKIAPSEGYNLKQRSPLDIEWLTAEERNWLIAVCASFNEIIIPEVKKQEAEREDSPWSVFNSRHDWKWIRNELIDRNWQVVSDYPDRVLLKRPGQSQQRASGKIFKEKSILYLFTVSTEFEDGKSYTPFGVYTMLYHDNNIALACRQLASEGCGKNNIDEGRFWKRNKSKIEIKYTELLSWLHGIGYRVYNKTIVQVINNIVEITDEIAMKRAFLNEVEYEMQDKMYEKVSTIFSKDGGLIAVLKELDDNFIRDTKHSIWLFFSNLAIEINSQIIPHEYNELTGYIWRSSIIQRDFYECAFEESDGNKFLDILAGHKKRDIQEIIGYSISQFKDPLNPRAVIIMEDIDADNEGESQGGSGKGLLFQFISQYRKPAFFDGKNFRASDQFLFQNVDADTAILFIDDVEKSFKFSSLFSILTGALLINKKNKPQISIPFERSPKVFITSNYSIGGMDISSARRKYEFAITKYFGEEIEPIDIFKREFFTGWDKQEWLRFDNLIVDCCAKYLGEEKKKNIGNITANSEERSLIVNTHKDFIDYMDSQLEINFFDFAPFFLKTKSITYKDGSSTTNAVNIEAYVHNQENPDYYFTITKKALHEKISELCKIKWLTTTKLTQWITRWASIRNVAVDTSYKRISDSDRMYKFTNWPFQLYSKNDKNESGN